MRPFVLIFFMVLISSLPTLSLAHAVIIQSSLDSGPVQADQPTEIHLIFNSDIEDVLSMVNLVSKGNRMHPLPIQKGKKRGELVVELPPLPPGEYALQLRVFAADGHLTEDILKFTVREAR